MLTLFPAYFQKHTQKLGLFHLKLIFFHSMLQLMNNPPPRPTGCDGYNSSLMDEDVPLCAASI